MELPKKKILAVDDDQVNLQVYDVLLRNDYDLLSVSSGAEALQVAETFKPDLILLDIMMPGMNGYETCKKIRSDPRLRFVKIILVSAESMVNDRLRGYDAGADDYVTKPFSPDELLAKIRVTMRLKSAEEVDQLKTDILSLLCHETRTPLNSIVGPGEILASEEHMDDLARKELASLVILGADKLLRLFEKVLLLSQIRAGKLEFEGLPVDLTELIDDTLAELKTEMKQKEVLVEVEAPPVLVAMGCDKHLRIVFKSILHNAIRFSPKKGVIRVSLNQEGTMSVVGITDFGPGIEPEHLPHIFEEFAVRNVLNHSEGTGLGLAISRAVATHLGGEVFVRSTPNVSTTFTVRLPMVETGVQTD